MYGLRDSGQIIALGGGVYRWADAPPADSDLIEIAETRPACQAVPGCRGWESFLARLAASRFADRLVLKGGVLLAAFGERRPTRDVDLQTQTCD